MFQLALFLSSDGSHFCFICKTTCTFKKGAVDCFVCKQRVVMEMAWEVSHLILTVTVVGQVAHFTETQMGDDLSTSLCSLLLPVLFSV